MAESAEDIQHHIAVYKKVFLGLAILTVVTVAASYLHLDSIAATVTIALFIASIKGTLVACYFMHLISEKKLIYMVLVVASLFFFFELLIPTITESGNIHSEEAAVGATHEG